MASAGTWKIICSIIDSFTSKGIDINSYFRGKIGDGNELRFWLDNWSGHGHLGEQFPELFKLEDTKKVNIKNRVLKRGDFNWKWKPRDWSQNAINELISLYSLDIDVMFNHNKDEWEWSMCKSKAFSVKSVRNIVTSYKKEPNTLIFPWNKLLPRKINVFGWRLLLNKLPSKDALLRRRVNINNVECILCGEQSETLEHLMTGCALSKELWNKIEVWCNMSPMIIFSVKDIIFYHEQLKGSKRRKEIIQSILLIACWVIWKSRNEMVFKDLKTYANIMLNDVNPWDSYGLKTEALNGIWRRSNGQISKLSNGLGFT